MTKSVARIDHMIFQTLPFCEQSEKRIFKK